jgi:WW domain-binding protein 2
MVFVPSKPTPTISAIEIPLIFVSEEKMSQPIFGANNLSGLVNPVDAPPNSSERIKWKLSFTNGGMGTLVPLFYATLEYLRVSSHRRHEAPPPFNYEQQPQPPPTMPQGPKPEPPSFVQTALLDPNDPTKVYLTSPVDPAQAIPDKYPVV